MFRVRIHTSPLNFTGTGDLEAVQRQELIDLSWLIAAGASSVVVEVEYPSDTVPDEWDVAGDVLVDFSTDPATITPDES